MGRKRVQEGKTPRLLRTGQIMMREESARADRMRSPGKKKPRTGSTIQGFILWSPSTTVAFMGCVRGFCNANAGRGVGVFFARLSVPRRVPGWWCGARRAGRAAV